MTTILADTREAVDIGGGADDWTLAPSAGLLTRGIRHQI
jgi:hypothetical protein